MSVSSFRTKAYTLFLISMFATVNSSALAGPYVQKCMEAVRFAVQVTPKPGQQLQPGELPAKLESYFVSMCTCQEAELKARGVSHQDIQNFIKATPTLTIRRSKNNDDKKILDSVERVNKLVNSPSVIQKCGSLLGG